MARPKSSLHAQAEVIRELRARQVSWPDIASRLGGKVTAAALRTFAHRHLDLEETTEPRSVATMEAVAPEVVWRAEQVARTVKQAHAGIVGAPVDVLLARLDEGIAIAYVLAQNPNTKQSQCRAVEAGLQATLEALPNAYELREFEGPDGDSA